MPTSSQNYLGDAKQLDGRPTSVQGPLLYLDLLKAETILAFVEVVQAWSSPLLILLGVLLLQTIDVLGQFLEDLFLELTLRLARTQLPVDPGRRALPSCGGRGENLKLALLG